jgi:hypothetical protein
LAGGNDNRANIHELIEHHRSGFVMVYCIPDVNKFVAPVVIPDSRRVICWRFFALKGGIGSGAFVFSAHDLASMRKRTWALYILFKLLWNRKLDF